MPAYEIVIEENNVVVEIANGNTTDTVVSESDTLVIEVAEQGPPGIQGPQGIQGVPGDVGIQVPFNFGDATPKNVAIVPANKLIYSAKICISVPFNGTASTLSLGDAGNAQRLVQTTEVDPYSEGIFETSPAYKYGSDTQVILTINQGLGCTQGSGIVVITFQT